MEEEAMTKDDLLDEVSLAWVSFFMVLVSLICSLLTGLPWEDLPHEGSFASIPSGFLRRYLTGKRLDWISLALLEEETRTGKQVFSREFRLSMAEP